MLQQRRKPVFLRLIATLLAATGLLGHGIAMVLVGLLASAGTADAETRYFSEICTPDGLVRLADLESPDSGDGGAKHGDPLNNCPICTAYAQLGTANLPAAMAIPALQCCSATQLAGRDVAARISSRPQAQPRAPPAIA